MGGRGQDDACPPLSRKLYASAMFLEIPLRGRKEKVGCSSLVIAGGEHLETGRGPSPVHAPAGLSVGD